MFYTRLFRIVLLLAVSSGISINSYGAEILKPGDTFPSLKAKDQHENDYEFKAGTKAVMITFDMSTGKKANKILKKKGADYLDTKKTVYISNIYGMPGIGRFFALPKMKKYPHRIILVDAENLLDPFPQKENHVTVILLDDLGKITAIDYWNPKEDVLKNFLK